MNQQNKVNPVDGQPPAYGMQPGYGNPPPGLANVQQQWAPAVQSMPGCPPGLEYLTTLDQVLIKQQIELLEAFTGWEQNNKYKVMNNQGQQVYFAAEDTDMCMRQCCGPQRSFVIHITDNMNQEVIRLSRDFKCCAGCCWCANADGCAHEVMIEAPVGQVVGYARQEYSSWSPNFTLRDADRNPILRIHGPCCVLNMPCCEDTFNVWSKDDTREVGTICKQKGLQEFFVDANTFGATFPQDLDVKVKAAMLGAVFLIDFMYLEKSSGGAAGY
ncbi:phospholipid scramblase 1-like isoform X2 [Mytilus galloprovincialis]|uniref:phospholipid scramblase 1-like isoform X2 n=1 Tax=Mytilus galloprovincialis TaxID=29158 RepID=UPI003F7BCEE3